VSRPKNTVGRLLDEVSHATGIHECPGRVASKPGSTSRFRVGAARVGAANAAMSTASASTVHENRHRDMEHGPFREAFFVRWGCDE
jgi:hypothetical protein